MKHNTKKGFTLVELLVVIAILAILATVSVVGYTSFIESANVAVDEDLVAQLNNFLAAYKVKNTDEITEDNAWEVTQEILELSGLDKINGLVPKSKDNHFYFNVDEQEYQLIPNIRVSGLGRHFFNTLVGAAGEYNKPGVFKTNDDLEQTLFLVDTTGWDVADVVRGFYSLDNYDDIKEFIDEAKTFELDVEHQNLAYWANNTVFVTSEGNFVADLETEHSNIVIYDDATAITNEKQVAGTTNKVTIPDGEPIITADNITIILPADIQVTAGALVVNGTNVTIVINANNWDSVKDTIDADFTNNDTTVVLGGQEYTIQEEKVFDASGNQATTLKYNNPMFTFDIMANGVANKVTDSTKEGYVAWDVENGQFTVKVTNAQGNPEKPGVAISITDVTWDVGADSVDYLEVVDKVNGVFQFKNHGASAPAIDTLTIVATPVIAQEGYEEGTKIAQTYTVKLVRATGISDLKLGTEDVDFANTVVLMNGEKSGETVTNSPFSLVEGGVKIHFNHTAAEGVIVLDDATLSLVANDTFNVSADGKTLTLVDTLGDLLKAKTITLNVGKYFTKEISISMYNQYKLNFVENTDNAQIKVVGDDNPITLGDLFKLQGGMNIPTNAQVWFSAGFGGTTTMPGNINMDEYSASRHGTTVTSLSDDWTKTPIQFNAGTNNSAEAPEVNVAIVVPTEDGGWRRISAVRSIKVVDGYNVKDYDTLTSLMNKTDKDSSGSLLTYPIKENSIVMIGDIAIPANATIKNFTIPSGKTWYGNTYTLNIENGRTVEAGIIELAGRIQDTKVVGKQYTEYAISVGHEWGSSAIHTIGGAAEIDNCYVTGCRSPLRTGGNTTVNNSIFYGGKHANIDITGGNLYIKGEVITVNQNDGSGHVGMGIAFWWTVNADNSKVVIEKDASGKEIAKLTQYNFVSENDKSKMPKIGLSILAAEVGVSIPSTIKKYLDEIGVDFGTIFTERVMGNNAYADYVFTKDGTKYVNAGIVYISEPVDSTDAVFQHEGRYGTATYTYDPSQEKYISIFNSVVQGVFQSVIEKKTGIKTLPIFMNSLKAQVVNDEGQKVNHEDNYAFFNTASEATTKYAPTYGFGADGNIMTYGE